MKFSPFFFTVHTVLILIACIIAIPSINIKVFDQPIKFEGIELGRIFGDQVATPHFDTAREFENQQLIIFSFPDLRDEEGNVVEGSSDIFWRNYRILQQRLSYIASAKSADRSDYHIRALEHGDGTYSIELYISGADTETRGILSTITAQGPIEIYEDDPNYVPDEAAADDFLGGFLGGKRLSSVISLEDVQSTSHFSYTNDQINATYFVIKTDFGEQNIDRVMQSANGTYVASNEGRNNAGIWLMQGGFPIAIQAEAINPPQPPTYPGQSYILFTPFMGAEGSMSSLAIASMVDTEGWIDTTIQIEGEADVMPVFQTGTIEYIKLLIPLGLVLALGVLFLMYKKKGLLFGIMLAESVVLAVAIAQFVSVKITSGFIVGLLAAALVFLMFLVFTISKSGSLNLGLFLRQRGNYWKYACLLGVLFIVWGVQFPNIALIVSQVLGIIFGTFASVIIMEISYKALAPLLDQVESEN
jgi:hypothetical protein